jgi:hypothetical protein
MKARDLVAVWGAPDNSRLTAKQASFRLPVHVAAKIAALCEMYPQKTKTQIVGDLLAAALTDLESELPQVLSSRFFGKDENGHDLFEVEGPAQTFRELTNKHYRELEIELGTEEPEPLFQGVLVDRRVDR